MKKKIKVTQTHINIAKNIDFNLKSRACTCPVALALKDHFTQVPVAVTRACCSIGEIYVHTPRSVKRFINRFDSDKPVKPFNFIINYQCLT